MVKNYCTGIIKIYRRTIIWQQILPYYFDNNANCSNKEAFDVQVYYTQTKEAMVGLQCTLKSFPLTLRFSNEKQPLQNKMALPFQRWNPRSAYMQQGNKGRQISRVFSRKIRCWQNTTYNTFTPMWSILLFKDNEHYL